MKKVNIGITIAILGMFPALSSVNKLDNISVKAADKEEVADVKLTKKVPYIVVHPGETVEEISSRRITDVTSNYGHVTGKYDMTVYPTLDNGDIDYGHSLSLYGETGKIKRGTNYKAIVNFDVVNLKGHFYNAHFVDNDGDWYVEKAINNYSNSVSLIVPLKVESKTSKKVTTKKVTTKVNLVGVVKGTKNKKIKTYTSNGKVSTNKVYGKHTYKLNQMKKLKGKTYYKVYGKSYWILATNLTIKNK